MRKSKWFLTALTAVLAAVVAIGSASAYFTTFVTASGSAPVTLGSVTKITEPDVDVENWVKHVTVENEGPSECYARIKAFAGSELKLNYNGEGWTDGGDGYWYYDEILPAEETSKELLITIDNVPEAALEGDAFNVVVVYESTKVLYDEAGDPLPADWTMKAEVVEGGDA